MHINNGNYVKLCTLSRKQSILKMNQRRKSTFLNFLCFTKYQVCSYTYVINPAALVSIAIVAVYLLEYSRRFENVRDYCRMFQNTPGSSINSVTFQNVLHWGTRFLILDLFFCNAIFLSVDEVVAELTICWSRIFIPRLLSSWKALSSQKSMVLLSSNDFKRL